jgi:hypothetical protein
LPKIIELIKTLYRKVRDDPSDSLSEVTTVGPELLNLVRTTEVNLREISDAYHELCKANESNKQF